MGMLGSHNPLTVGQRRLARRLLYYNGAIWAVGNGLVSTMLVVYLAMDLDAPGIALGVGFLLAMPNLVGVLRLGAPALIARLGDRKRFCIVSYLAAACVLLAVPWVAAPGMFSSGRAAMVVLVALWCVYHLLQYLATVALWSWLADLVPQRIRGRFLGRRERWMVVGQAAAMLAAGVMSWLWVTHFPHLPRWIGHAVPALLGAWVMMVAVMPLVWLPSLTSAASSPSGTTLSATLAPFADRRFLRLVAFGCWFSFFNGVTQSAHYTYAAGVLAMALLPMLSLRSVTRVGEFLISPMMGRWADRWGNRPVMLGSLLVVAQGPLFYFLATPERPWWIAGAWLAWIAYAGMNVALPNLMLRLAPRESNAPYIAMYFAVTGVCYAASTIVGGAASDHWRDTTFWLGGQLLDYYAAVFLFGWITRSLGALILLWVVVEPRH